VNQFVAFLVSLAQRNDASFSLAGTKIARPNVMLLVRLAR